MNDIISLLVGLWAVKAAQKTSSDKYSFGVRTFPSAEDWDRPDSIIVAES